MHVSQKAHETPHRLAKLQDGDVEARLEQWEMVVGASRLYDWHESRLRSPTQAALARTLSSESQLPDNLRSSVCSGPPCQQTYDVLLYAMM